MDTLLDTILQLPPTDRLQLLEQIWDSLDTPIPFPLGDHPLVTHTRRQGWNEQFAKAAQDDDQADDLDREWLDAPLTDWDQTEWEW
jgi:Putative addiction module component